MGLIDSMRRNAALWIVGLIILIPVLLWMIVICALAWNQTRFIYPGMSLGKPNIEAGWRSITVRTRSHGIITSYVRDGVPGRPVVVFLHGNWGSLGSSASATRTYAESGMTVVVPEWPGYAGNPGIPSADGLADASLSTYDAMTSTGIPESSLVVIGNSLGSAPAIEIATRRSPAGLILISAFTDMRIMAKRRFPFAPGFMLTDAFDNADDIIAVRRPITIVHGSKDDFVPTSMGLELAARTRTTPILVDAGHDAAYTQATQDAVAARIEALTDPKGAES